MITNDVYFTIGNLENIPDSFQYEDMQHVICKIIFDVTDKEILWY